MHILILQLGHNATAALSDGNSVIEVISQEKFDNIKNSSSFPIDAINYILVKYKLSKDDITQIINSGNIVFPHMLIENKDDCRPSKKNKLKLFHRYIDYKLNNKLVNAIFDYRISKYQSKSSNILTNKLQELGFNNFKLEFIEHHTCHTFSPLSLYGDSNDKFLIFAMDGMGDFNSSMVSIYNSGSINTIAKTSHHSSIGYIYSITTVFLGMKALEHEYKVMGLAAYSKKNYYMETYNKIFKNIVTINDDLTFESRFPTRRFYHYLKSVAVGERFDNIAGALQHFTEELVTKWISAAIKKTGIKNIMTSGGVFMNVKMNQKILSLPEVEKAFFMPSCGDESNVFGAAAYFVKNELKKDIKQNLPIYFGMEYSNSQVEEFININKLADKYNVKYVEDIEIEIARLLADFNTVARFAGRTEFGARSLGNRALLANPSDMKSFYTVNDQIKVRDFWMPFAPSMLDTYADKYLINYDKDKYNPYYMMATYESTKEFQKHCRAAMHQGDKTARPQIVTKEMNSKYYKVIKEFEKLTGIGAILNTSFNLHGYPLVGTLEQAIFTFENSGPGYLAIENWLISKKLKN